MKQAAPILLIGTGQMAIDYLQVLQAYQLDVVVVGRGQASAEKFESTTGLKPVQGGIQNYLAANKPHANTHAIIATGTEALLDSLKQLLAAGVTNILIEKPAAISIEELLQHADTLQSYTANIYVAYNRRFYASVLEVEKLIAADGGLLSMQFEFTEWPHKIEPLTKAAGVKENWFFTNSTHVIDLAFHLAGKPTDWHTYAKTGKLQWHPTTNFAGAGVTEKGVLFSYLSNWESAGRWSIELLTEQRRIYLKPLEDIFIQPKGTVRLDAHEFDKSADLQFKPGLKLQVESFLSDQAGLLPLQQHIDNCRNIYAKVIAP